MCVAYKLITTGSAIHVRQRLFLPSPPTFHPHPFANLLASKLLCVSHGSIIIFPRFRRGWLGVGIATTAKALSLISITMLGPHIIWAGDMNAESLAMSCDTTCRRKRCKVLSGRERDRGVKTAQVARSIPLFER